MNHSPGLSGGPRGRGGCAPGSSDRGWRKDRWQCAPASARAATLGAVSDQKLISRFYSVMTEDFPASADPEAAVELRAELLHRICLADGLLEVLEWSTQGTAADPLACMWLAGLRWHRLLTGAYPQGAPEPPPRQTDAGLAQLLETGLVRITDSSGATSQTALASGELHYPAAPAQPHADDQEVLLRLAPLALVPYIDEQMRMRWVEQNVSMTHGGDQLLEQSRRLVTELHRRASSHQPAAAEHDAAPPAGSHPLFGVMGELAQRWAEVTAAQ